MPSIASRLTLRRNFLLVLGKLLVPFMSCHEEGVSLGRLEIVLDEIAGERARADVPLVHDALLETSTRAGARARANLGDFAILEKTTETKMFSIISFFRLLALP